MSVFKLSRREWLRLGLGASATGAIGLGLGFFGGTRYERRAMRVPPRPEPFSPSVFLAIDHDGVTTIFLTRSEMGQGVATALPMIVAEELDADWRAVRVEKTPYSPSFGNQMTVASGSVTSLYDELRRAGAIARAMLITAAAETWDVSPETCRASEGAVEHTPTGRRIGYGTLAPIAGALPVPSDAPLKDPRAFTLVGRPTARKDTPEKVDGSAVFGLDVRRPGMLFASIERPTAIEGRITRFDAAAARAIEGVVDVFETPGGVAVVAESSWAALAGRRALAAEHDDGPHATLTSEGILEALRARTERGGVEARSDGDVEAAMARATRRLEAIYEVPFLAHACMEPINATAEVRDGRVTIWAPTQHPQAIQEQAAALAGVPVERCDVHVTYLGGGFGRRIVPLEALEAVRMAQRMTPRPVQIVWRREDDIQHDFYRPAAVHRFAIGLDAEGQPIAWRDHLATPTREGDQADGGDLHEIAVEGARAMPYAVPNVEVRWADVAAPIDTGIWRSVGHSYDGWALESMIDEAAHAAGEDPVRYRLALLSSKPRHRAVLERATQLARWGEAVPEGRARGVAVHECYGSICAQVAEVSQTARGVRVHRVWAAIDCGRAVNPSGVEAQIEGGIVFGLTAALYGDVRIERGRIAVSNFHDYPLLRIDEMPEIEVAIIERDAPPSGVGELGVPPIAPAVTNALFALTGTRIRRLPIIRD